MILDSQLNYILNSSDRIPVSKLHYRMKTCTPLMWLQHLCITLRNTCTYLFELVERVSANRATQTLATKLGYRLRQLRIANDRQCIHSINIIRKHGVTEEKKKTHAGMQHCSKAYLLAYYISAFATGDVSLF